MLNNLPKFAKIHEIYDLKGSSVGRQSSVAPVEKRLKALKDLDFEQLYPYGIRIPSEIYRRLRITIGNDVFTLRKMMITDFSLMLGIHHLDSLQTPFQPQLGISSIFSQINLHPTVTNSETSESIEPTDPKLISKFIMKPLNLIASAYEITFPNCSIASSLSGIPGLTHDGRRVLIYPALIDCLQTFDQFKRMQHALQNIRDPKRGSEYR